MSTTHALTERMLLRLEAEEFLIDEAALLDAWRMDEWLALFTEDCRYIVPSTDRPHGDPSRDLTLVDDDHERLYWRVNRLKSRHAHREFPSSRTRRLITNVRVLEHDEDGMTVTCTIVVHRFRHQQQDQFVGRYEHVLVRTPDGLRIKGRRAELDLERLSPNGSISMVF
ncbi:aromatic-ring-hydroxylating dioxygenase subunit beta [Paraconexibacter antarcticus]|uniref:Aromatic-ring-hydroxylating dioxygenase subunit beta n=1 Tax=Paraconexibacter antarcticus TaxID=2949664 RepID=A0ABY5DSB0_9ACTN|nr:aromatic-ring-hydroxylating dioxygenase subunit beta [Paraconexibacter antarcticus]UTI63627.1 aromatic-ring-hydroxylating dioxygenase subunit beta [Paraconexibacter antarcticus]